jgi:hypothetical protein
MQTSIYKITFSKSSYDLNDDYERLSDYEKESISNLSADAFFDYDDDSGRYVCFLITNINEIRSYTSILKNNLVTFKLNNLSEDIINANTDLESELRGSNSTISQIKLNIFLDGVNDWILENLDIDTVLDRINQVGGLNNLKQVEKDFLNNYKTK